MSISGALNNALTGLTASSRMAEIVSSNLSNALTDGYARRAVDLASAQFGGVRIDGITRFVDAGLLADRRLSDATLAGEQRTADMLRRLETTLGTPDDAGNVTARLAAFEAALIRASGDPASEQRLAAAVAGLDDVVTTIRRNDDAIQSLRQEADGLIARDIAALNRNLKQVEALNADILRLTSSGDDPSSLLDARQVIVDEISTLVKIRETLRDDGTIRIMTTSGLTLVDGRAQQFEFVQTPTITGDMTFASGALSGITIAGQPLDLNDGVGRLDGGAIAAGFVMRDRTLVEVQAGLDHLAADLIARFADPANDPTITAGDPGLLTDEGNALNLADLPGLAGRIALNAAIDPLQGGLAERLRDGLATLPAGPSGDPSQLTRWINALAVNRSDVPGEAIRSASGRAASFSAQVSSARFDADENLTFANARSDTLRKAELADGVDTDFELQRLLQVEQAYAANAKVIETVDFMMRRLMEI